MQLYANYCGFRVLGGLERYTELRCLFLEGNGLDSLAGLPLMSHLKCLCAPSCLLILNPFRCKNDRMPVLEGNGLDSLQGQPRHKCLWARNLCRLMKECKLLTDSLKKAVIMPFTAVIW